MRRQKQREPAWRNKGIANDQGLAEIDAAACDATPHLPALTQHTRGQFRIWFEGLGDLLMTLRLHTAPLDAGKCAPTRR